MPLSDNPFSIIEPKTRWKPKAADKKLVLPPLVENIRQEVYEWRKQFYPNISDVSRALLKWWFIDRDIEETGFQYYFCQREAIESLIYLYECRNTRTKADLIRFDKHNVLDERLLPENWLRTVIKMATGSGKTKVMSLAIVWSYFHKKLVKNSGLSKNFLIMAPYLIVLERLAKDFENLSIFNLDPIIPDNDFENIRWRDLFQMQTHIQDQVQNINPEGNIFLTNVDRVYLSRGQKKGFSKQDENTKDYFLGEQAVSVKRGYADLRKILSKVEDLVVINDEAHHIHDEKLAWYKTIESLNNNLIQQYKNSISIHIDFTATPKDQKGNIFPQVVCDYPLVEAIHQNIVKRPIIPGPNDLKELKETKKINFADNWSRYINLGVEHWKKVTIKNNKVNKKSVLFIMCDETKSCEEVKDYLESHYDDFSDKKSVLVIHINDHGEFVEDKKTKAKKELQSLRDYANTIDANLDINPYKVVISVLMLKEGWDVRNITTIVGLRAFSSKAKILPEQTIGRGLRRMFPKEKNENLVVIGTPLFMEFIEELDKEGVIIDTPHDDGPIIDVTPIIVEIDKSKDLEKLDIRVPVLRYRLSRDFSRMNEIDINELEKGDFSLEEIPSSKEYTYTFRDILTKEIGEKITIMGDKEIIPESIIGFFVKHILKQLRLGRGFEILCGKFEQYIEEKLFNKIVSIDNIEVLKNLQRLEVNSKLIEVFVDAINKIIVQDSGTTEIDKYISVCDCPAFRSDENDFIQGVNTPFNYQVGNDFELEIAQFLSSSEDIISYTKNFETGIGFYMDYQKTSGKIGKYYPDFLIKISDTETCILETKGREDDNDKRKHARLIQWCESMNQSQKEKHYIPLYILQEDWKNLAIKPTNFSELVKLFKN